MLKLSWPRMPRRNGAGFLARLARAKSGVAAVEFAMIAPVFITLGMGGIETAYMMSVNQQVSSLALSVADNASRMEQTNNNAVTPTVTYNDIDSVMKGAMKEGATISFSTNGRIVLSSLEKDATTGKQYIHWQRCGGSLSATSAYGNDSTQNGLNGAAITGMGSGATRVAATDGSAVMFVEVYYRYTGLFGNMIFSPFTMKKEGAYIIRDIRNLGTAGSNPISGTGSSWGC